MPSQENDIPNRFRKFKNKGKDSEVNIHTSLSILLMDTVD